MLPPLERGTSATTTVTTQATQLLFFFTVRPHQLHCQLAKAHRCDDVESTVMSQLRVSYVMQQCSTIEPVFFLPLDYTGRNGFQRRLCTILTFFVVVHYLPSNTKTPEFLSIVKK